MIKHLLKEASPKLCFEHFAGVGMCVCVGGGVCDNSTSFTSKDTVHRDISPITLLKDG